MATIILKEHVTLGQGLMGSGQATQNDITISNNGASSGVAAFSIIGPSLASVRFKEIVFYVASVSGSPTITAEFWSDSGGLPSANIETGSVTVSPTGAGWNTCSGFTTTSNMTEGTQYWVLLKCTAGTSANIRFNLGAGSWWSWGGSTLSTSTGTNFGSMNHLFSNDNTSTWTGSVRAQIGGVLLGVTDGTDTGHLGNPIINSWAAQSSSDEKLYRNGSIDQEFGSLFTTQANMAFTVGGIFLYLRRSGSPTGDVRVRIYKGTTLERTSHGIKGTNISASGAWYLGGISPPYTFLPSTSYRITVGNTAADDSSNYFYTYAIAINTDYSYLLPFGGLQTTKNATGSWVETNNEFFHFLLQGSASVNSTPYVQTPTNADITAAVWTYANRTLTG